MERERGDASSRKARWPICDLRRVNSSSMCCTRDSPSSDEELGLAVARCGMRVGRDASSSMLSARLRSGSGSFKDAELTLLRLMPSRTAFMCARGEGSITISGSSSTA